MLAKKNNGSSIASRDIIFRAIITWEGRPLWGKLALH